jgi:hypothetical protein
MKKACLIVAVLLILSMVLVACDPDTEGKTYRIWYHANGAPSGFPPSDNRLYKSGETADVKDKNTLLYTGHEFLYWNTKPDGSGNTYHPGDTITIKSSAIFLSP